MNFTFKNFELVGGKLTEQANGQLLGLYFRREVDVNGALVQAGVQEVFAFDGFNCNFANKVAHSHIKRFVKIHDASDYVEMPLTDADMPSTNGAPIFRSNGTMVISNDYGVRLSDMSPTGLFEHYVRVLDESGQETSLFAVDQDGNRIVKDGYIGMYDFYFQNLISPIIYLNWQREVKRRIESTGNTITNS